MRSAVSAWRAGEAHCLEATFLAARILETKAHPPLYLYLDSQDNLGHVVYLFKSGSKWGAIGRSKETGLQGRKAVFLSIEEMVWSYVDPYVDETGRVVGYSTGNLNEVTSPWRDSKRQVWRAEREILSRKTIRISASALRHKRALDQFRNGGHQPMDHWWY